tara:strand:- start:9804 stop:11405 length:1602 start_codon:yes stop_codon:yes gene_type:complete
MNNSLKEALQIQELSLQYPNNVVWTLNGLSLKIAAGERLALIGSSGCGKSSVAKAVLQILPDGSFCKGDLLLTGKSITRLNENKLQQIRGESVGLIFQDPMTRLNPLMTIGHHLIDTLSAHKCEKDFNSRKERALELLTRVGIDSKRFNSYPHEFSGGMRQRLGIALAIALNPPLLIADEPTTSLDALIANQVMAELSSLCNEFNTALLLITHDLPLAARWCQRMAILDQGKIVEDGMTIKLLKDPQSVMGKRLVRSARAREGLDLSANSTGLVILEVERLRCWHDMSSWPWQVNWIKAVDEVSFSLSSREILGIVGPSGCGKSTLCRALIGLLPIRGGNVKLNGENLFSFNGQFIRNARQKIQMVFQDSFSCLNPKMSIGEAICEPLLIHNICNKREAKEKSRTLLTQVGLTPPEEFQNRFPKELSGGQQQRVAIARAIALQPQVLICDESISMLDVEIQADILQLLSSLQTKLGLAILFITHDLSVASGFCNRLFIMDKGRIVEEGRGRQLLLAPRSTLGKKLVNASPRLP